MVSRRLNICYVSERYRIPWILSCGKSTEKKGEEYAVNKQGEATDEILNTGLMGNLIDIDPKGKITVKTITF